MVNIKDMLQVEAEEILKMHREHPEYYEDNSKRISDVLHEGDEQ